MLLTLLRLSVSIQLHPSSTTRKFGFAVSEIWQRVILNAKLTINFSKPDADDMMQGFESL